MDIRTELILAGRLVLAAGLGLTWMPGWVTATPNGPTVATATWVVGRLIPSIFSGL